jgi:tRNA pseudouridine55 synthase
MNAPAKPYNNLMGEIGYFLNIDKPAGMTSRDVVNRVVKFAKTRRVGHAGTLDPLATGVLVVAIEKATRLVEYVQQQPKIYEAEFLLGQSSDTDDIEGRIEHRLVSQPPTRAEIEQVLSRFQGEIDQLPPKYSALKIGGRAAYDLARKGLEVDLKPRRIRIDLIELTGFDYPRVEMTVACGSGTYIRSIARDLGEALGVGGLMSRLRRTAVGVFQIADAVGIEQLADGVHRPLADAVGHLPRLQVDAEGEIRFHQGKVFRRMDSPTDGIEVADVGDCSKEFAVFNFEGCFLGIGILLSPDPPEFRAVKGGFAASAD